VIRPLLILVLLVGAILGVNAFTPHHAGENVFITLFAHLVPQTLVAGGHGEHAASHALFSFDAPWLFPAGDGDPYKPGTQIALSNLQVFQILAIVLVAICFSGVPRYLRTGQGDKTTRLFSGFALWVRDDMVYPIMGKEMGRKFLPYLLSLFFFILFMNLLGLVPGAATATASVFVTAGLALTTLLVMVFGGMIAQGPFAYWKNLVPHVPIAIWPILAVVEFVGIFVKPFALMIRLFANMTGGHMVVLSFMGLLFVAARMAGETAAWATSPLLVGFAVFIMIIESFVALLQAYVFTMLSILFIQASIHPEH
jgi:F-type H+-transporting ATPase subunit a